MLRPCRNCHPRIRKLTSWLSAVASAAPAMPISKTKMKYKYILFDLDGTITESGPGIVNSVEYALHKLGYEEKDRESLKRFIGPPLTESMMKFYKMTEEQADQGVVYYREYYVKKGIFENSIYDGFIDSIKKLKEAGLTLAVATSKPEKFAKIIADKFDFAKYFATKVLSVARFL